MKTPTASHYLHGLLAPNGASDGDGWCVAEESNVDARGGETGACGGDGQVACGLCGAGEGGAWRVRQEACIRAARTYGIQHSAFSIQHSAFSTIVPRHCTHTAMNLPCNPLAHSLPHETYIPRAHHHFYHTTNNGNTTNEEHTQQHTHEHDSTTHDRPLINTRSSYVRPHTTPRPRTTS